MNAVADYAEAYADKVREKIESYSNFNAPQPSFRQLELTNQSRFLRLGYADALYPNRPDSREFFALQDGAQVAIVVGLVPDRKPCQKTISLLCDSFGKIDFSKQERNLPVYFLDGYYRSI